MKFSSEEELYSYLRTFELRGLDSEYSFIYDGIIKSFNAKGLDLNSWWVKTPADWECPACQRSKTEIMRPNKHGYLTGHIHEHHDHMSELVGREFDRISSSRECVVADFDASTFVQRTAYAASAFDSTLICSDCNTADVKAKRIVSSPLDFSFSPRELAQFIEPRPHSDHKINRAQALAIWKQCEPVFQRRCEFIVTIAELAASNEHWFQESKKPARAFERNARSLFKYYGIDSLQGQFPEHFLFTPKKYPKSFSGWRKKRVRLSPQPSQGEIDHLLQTNIIPSWHKFRDDWECPCCLRSKYQCISKNNKGEWDFGVESKRFCTEYDPKVGIYHEVCRNCASAAIHFGKETASGTPFTANRASALLKLSELSAIIKPNAFNRHHYNDDVASNVIEVIQARILSGNVIDDAIIYESDACDDHTP